MSVLSQYHPYQEVNTVELDSLTNGNSVAESSVQPATPQRRKDFWAGSYEMLRSGPINGLLVIFPFAFVSKLMGMADGLTFTLSLLALAPLAERLGFVTEQLALHTNESIGGLLNATFGNATELIVAAAALFRGLYRLVQLSMLGSILSNMLLVLGSAFLIGGSRFKTQTFSKISSQMNATLLILSCFAVLGPTVLTTSSDESRLGELGFSRITSVLLLLVYFAFLYFQLVSHRSLYENSPPATSATAPTKPSLSTPRKFAKRSTHSTPVKTVRADVVYNSIPTSPTHYETGLSDPPSSASRLYRRETASTPGTPAAGVGGSSAADAVSEGHIEPMQLGEEEEEYRNNKNERRNTRMRIFRRCCACTCICSGCCYTAPPAASSDSSHGVSSSSTDQPRDASSSNGTEGAPKSHAEEDILGFRNALLWLGMLTVFITLLSDMVASSIERAADDVGISGVFLAAIVLPIVSNAAEHASAISFAMRNKLDISLGVAVGSSTQIALCVLPMLVILGWASGHDMSLNFGAYESSTLFLCVVGVTFAIKDGTANWLLGVIMVAAYVIVAVGFFAHKNDSLQ